MFEILSTINKIEDISKLKEAGATGIIVGDGFHANRLTRSFLHDEIIEICKDAKKHSLKVFVKMNRVYIDNELDEAYKYMQFLKELDIDAIYFNDLGLYSVAKKLNMSDKLIYDPDTILTNHFDVNYHLSKGIYGVVLSKEITKEEMIMIAEKSIGKTSVIVHGYLNMSYAKRKLIKNYFEFIGKDTDISNRRDLYLIEENRDGKMPIIEDDQGTMVFTDYVQESFDEILELYSAGVTMFIVDGIFLDSECIVDAIKMYSDILNGKENKKAEYYKKYSYLPLSTGYMEKATNLVK